MCVNGVPVTQKIQRAKSLDLEIQTFEAWSPSWVVKIEGRGGDSIEALQKKLNFRPKKINPNLFHIVSPENRGYSWILRLLRQNRNSLKLMLMDIPSVTLISTTIGLGEECEHWSREFVPELRPRLYSPEHTALLHIWLLCAPCTHCKSEHKRTHTHTHILHLLLCTHAHTHTNTPSHTSFLWMFWIAHPQDAQVDREEGVDTHKRDLTHSHVWRDSFTCVTRLIHMLGMTHPHVWHDWFTCVTWRGHLYSNVWHDSVTCVTWLIRMCGMTDSNVWHDWITCVAWLIPMCGTTHSHVRHDSSTCVVWPAHMCGMTRSHVSHDVVINIQDACGYRVAKTHRMP